jgi:type IV pilus assembly protein PilW
MKNHYSHQRGFSLIEIMITLVLGLMISGAIIQVMVSNSVTDKLNRAMASAQEGGRYIIAKMRSDLLMTGRYDSWDPELDIGVDIVDESAFVQNHAVPIPGDFVNNMAIGALQGAAGASDTLVIGFQGSQDCRGLDSVNFGYAADTQFYVVNEYFVDGTKLKCRGFDGRVLRGQQVLVGNNTAYTLLDDVYSFQVLYGLSNNVTTGDFSGRPIRFVRADQLAAEYLKNSMVVAIRIAILLKGDGEVSLDHTPSFALLNEDAITPAEKRLFKQFETTITLRNVKNFLRNRKI